MAFTNQVKVALVRTRLGMALNVTDWVGQMVSLEKVLISTDKFSPSRKTFPVACTVGLLMHGSLVTSVTTTVLCTVIFERVKTGLFCPI